MEFLRNDEACEETLFAQMNWESARALAKFLKNDEAYEETELAPRGRRNLNLNLN